MRLARASATERRIAAAVAGVAFAAFAALALWRWIAPERPSPPAPEPRTAPKPTLASPPASPQPAPPPSIPPQPPALPAASPPPQAAHEPQPAPRATAPTHRAAPQKPAAPAQATRWYVQVAAFDHLSLAKKRLAALRRKGWRVRMVQKDNGLVALWIGPYASEKEARRKLRFIRGRLAPDAFIVRR